jgi:hypothetical protein
MVNEATKLRKLSFFGGGFDFKEEIKKNPSRHPGLHVRDFNNSTAAISVSPE